MRSDMAFVRSKVVEGHTYYQLVQNHREAGKHRQKVLCHLGRYSSLALAIEDKNREVEELRGKSDELFGEITEIKQSILDGCGELVGQKIPSLKEADTIEEKAHEALLEYRDHPLEHPEHEKRREMWWKTMGLYNRVFKYHSLWRDACWYEDRATEAQEKKDKLIEFKEKYPHL
jgi:hypothetical protein